MKKTALLMVLVLLLFTACSPAQDSESKPDLEELTDNVYVGYDRTKYENVSAPSIYYAESIDPDDSVLASFFSTPPTTTYDDGAYHYLKNDVETGYYSIRGGVFYGSKDWANIRIASEYCLVESVSSIKDLDFMPLSELYKRFEEDAHKFIDNVEIYEMTAITSEDFAKATTLTDPSNLEKGWCEPKEVYYIRARQFINDIPLFTGHSETDVEAGLVHYGARIEAYYTKDGLEHFDIIGGYKIGEEKPTDAEFIDLKGAEQIISDEYAIPYGYENIVLVDVGLVYVGTYDDDNKTILTPAWEFYVELPEHSLTWRCSMDWIRINAYTGEFMR